MLKYRPRQFLIAAVVCFTMCGLSAPLHAADLKTTLTGMSKGDFLKFRTAFREQVKEWYTRSKQELPEGNFNRLSLKRALDVLKLSDPAKLGAPNTTTRDQAVAELLEAYEKLEGMKGVVALRVLLQIMNKVAGSYGSLSKDLAKDLAENVMDYQKRATAIDEALSKATKDAIDAAIRKNRLQFDSLGEALRKDVWDTEAEGISIVIIFMYSHELIGREVAIYTEDKGRIFGKFVGGKLIGKWSETDSVQTCSVSYDGRKHWGKLEFTFNKEIDAFEGVWGYCDGPLDKTWNGNRI